MHISLKGISKRYGDTLANDSVDLDLAPGRVTALLGENGAGKSTLMKIAFGAVAPDAGEIIYDGEVLMPRSPRQAIERGVGMVFQQFSLIPALTVRENLVLAARHMRWWLGRKARRVTAPLQRLRQWAPEIDPDQPAGQLSVGELQLVELVKVLNLEARTIILDEPTSVLAPSEAEALRQRIGQLGRQGVGVVLITHKLEDVFACCEDVVVMRAGRVVARAAVAAVNAPTLVRWIVGDGRETAVKDVPAPEAGKERVRLRGITTAGAQGTRLEQVEMSIRAGEIVGVAGVSGNGQQALAEAVAGMLPLRSGEVIVDGSVLQAAGAPSPAHAEVAYLPEQPLRNAVASNLSVAVNLLMKQVRDACFILNRGDMAARATELIDRFGIRPADPAAAAGTLSGGNLQKLVAARELSGEPALVVACYPTMGLDLSASAAVYDALFAHARRGACVLWISEDLDDLLRYAHRIEVMHGGRIVGSAPAHADSRGRIGAWMTGHSHA